MYDATFKIVIFGDPNVGKEAITQKFLTNLFVSESKMTIGVDFEVKSLYVDGLKVKLQIWDYGTEERFKFLLPTYVRGARGGIFVYDLTNSTSFAHIDDWLSLIRREIGTEVIFPIIVVGNRADLIEKRHVSWSKAITTVKSRNLDGLIEISIKTGENVDEAFQTLTRVMLNETKLTRIVFKTVTIVEIKLNQLKESVQEYLNQKSKTNKQIIRATSIKAVKKSLKIAVKIKSWDEDIWFFAIELSQSICIRITPKTIYFR